MHTTLFRSLPADPAWGAGCGACVRPLPMRDRARAMRPARHVGLAGKERFSGRFGVGFWVGFWVGLRARDFPTERVLSRTPLIIRTAD